MDSIFTFLATLTAWGLTIYEWIIIVAILVTWVNPDPSNPIVQFLNNMTVPVWNMLRAHLPSSLQYFAAYISLLLVWFLKIFLPGVFLTLGGLSNGSLAVLDAPGVLSGYFLLGLGVVAQSLLFFLTILLVIWFFLTLINPSINNPIVRTLYILVDPFITPIQKRIPRQRIDLSPLIVAGIFLALNFFVVGELIRFAAGLAHGVGIVQTLGALFPSGS